MLSQQLIGRSLNRGFASFTLHGADERHLFHHQLMQCRLVLRLARLPHSDIRPRQIVMRK